MDNSSERETAESGGLKITVVPKNPSPTVAPPAGAVARPPAPQRLRPAPFCVRASHVPAPDFTAGRLSVPTRLCLFYLPIYFLSRSHL